MLNALKLLLVEDDAVDRKAVHRALRGSQATISDAECLEQAKDLARRERFDCALLDWHLPDGRAVTLLEHMRRTRTEIPVVVLTGADDHSLAEQVLQAGAQDYLIKGGFDRDQLMRAIRYAIERHRAAKLKSRLMHADRLASVGRMAAGVAHEVNNPATFVMTNLVILERMLSSDAMEAKKRTEMLVLVDECERGMSRINTLMRQLGGFSRLTSGAVSWVAMEDVVRDGLRMARPSMRHRAVVEVEIDPVPPLALDRDAITGVVVNLLVNAQQAIDSAADGDHRIFVRLIRTDTGSELTVEDTGVGIPGDDLDRIFEPFFTRTKEGGTGLGLSICHDVVMALGGTIHAENSALGGARFRVQLPEKTGLDVAEVADHATRMPTGLRILVVEDEPLLRRALRRMLGGHTVYEASSAAEARAILEGEERVDVVLCDLMMPDTSGAVFYAELAEAQPQIAKRLVFITGGAVTPGAEAFLRSSPAPVLYKPFSAKQLEQTITSMLFPM